MTYRTHMSIALGMVAPPFSEEFIDEVLVRAGLSRVVQNITGGGLDEEFTPPGQSIVSCWEEVKLISLRLQAERLP